MSRKSEDPVLSVLLVKARKQNPDITNDQMKEAKSYLKNYLGGFMSYSSLEAHITRIIGSDDISKLIKAILEADEDPIPKGEGRRSTMRGQESKLKLWTQQEDVRLLAGIHKLGLGNWGDIAAFVGGDRTRSQCSQRWHRCLDPIITKKRWSKEEEERMLKAIAKYGHHSWTKVAKAVGTRCDVQCRYRYHKIMSISDKESGKDEIEVKERTLYSILTEGKDQSCFEGAALKFEDLLGSKDFNLF